MIQNTNFFKYMEETRKHPVLKEQEARSLLSQSLKDDSIADVISRNLQLVCRLVLAWKYSADRCGVDLMDLVGAGNIGLIQGTVNYDPSKGSYFWYITRYIKGFIKSEFYKSIGCVRGSNRNAVTSLDQIVADNDEGNPVLLKDVIPDIEAEQAHVILDCNNLLSELRSDYKAPHRLSGDIVELRYGIGSRRHCKPLSYRQTAKVLGHISKEGVRKIENKTLSFLKSQC
jgi:RNA polymerase sigma factor (sigma-70 family)